MAEKEAAASGGDDISYQERGVDVEVPVVSEKRNPETASQLGTEETDGKSTKKRKKAAQRIIQDGE